MIVKILLPDTDFVEEYSTEKGQHAVGQAVDFVEVAVLGGRQVVVRVL